MLADDQTRNSSVLDLDRLEARLPVLAAEYQSAAPFPHIVLDDFLVPAAASAAIHAVPALGSDEWMSYVHVNERKYANVRADNWAPVLQDILEELQSPRFVEFLTKLTGIDGLVNDETLEGGGLHQTPAGGFLNVHADFTVHPKQRHLRRRVNLLLYLNEQWLPEYGGDLELWARDMSRAEAAIAPIANRVVIFNTDADSYHGHPEPLTCPEGMTRRSLALYYFTAEDAPVVRSTNYRARPGDGARGLFIYADKQLLKLYDAVKRRSGVSDAKASRWLKWFDRRAK